MMFVPMVVSSVVRLVIGLENVLVKGMHYRLHCKKMESNRVEMVQDHQQDDIQDHLDDVIQDHHHVQVEIVLDLVLLLVNQEMIAILDHHHVKVEIVPDLVLLLVKIDNLFHKTYRNVFFFLFL
jgi:siroheme synthase